MAYITKEIVAFNCEVLKPGAAIRVSPMVCSKVGKEPDDKNGLVIDCTEKDLYYSYIENGEAATGRVSLKDYQDGNTNILVLK